LRIFDHVIPLASAGIIGSCTAHATAGRSARVLLLERFDLLQASSTSSPGTATPTPSAASPAPAPSVAPRTASPAPSATPTAYPSRSTRPRRQQARRRCSER
jgi:glycine/D-amino acid oxidase-like deaminating enzyme